MVTFGRRCRQKPKVDQSAVVVHDV
jgi:hypothetical protein